MNREVHYIFSIQTPDYLKSAWERGRRVYLMISPIAQCRADASGEISGESCGEGETEQRASCLSDPRRGWSKGKGEDRRQLEMLSVPAAPTFELSTQTNSHTSRPLQVLPSGLTWVRIFCFFHALHFLKSSAWRDFMYGKFSWRAHSQSENTRAQTNSAFLRYPESVSKSFNPWSEPAIIKTWCFPCTTAISRCFCVCDLCFASCPAAVWFKFLWDDRRGLWRGGGARREEAGPSCLALSNDLCIMKDGDNISHSLQGSTLWQDLHIHIFFPPPPLPVFFFFFSLQMFFFFFFLCAGHLPPCHCSGGGEINKYVCREAHDPSRCHRNMARCWHLPYTPTVCVFRGLSTRKSC